MIKKETIETIVNQHLDGTDLFLVSVQVTEKNQIIILIDGDRGVTVGDCIALNRHIEQQIDRETEDYSVEVSSYGIGNPLLMPRQYIKNMGRLLEVHIKDGNIYTGRIKSADEEGVEIATEDTVKRVKGQKAEPTLHHFTYELINKSFIQVEF